MRFSHFPLLATVALLSSCNAIATVSGEGQVMTSADAVVPVRALEANNGKRSLRYYDTDEDDKTDKFDDNEEERGVMTEAQIAKWTARAEEWVEMGKTPAYIKDKLTAFNGAISDKNYEKYMIFTAAYAKKHPEELGRR